MINKRYRFKIKYIDSVKRYTIISNLYMILTFIVEEKQMPLPYSGFQKGKIRYSHYCCEMVKIWFASHVTVPSFSRHTVHLLISLLLLFILKSETNSTN